MSTRKGEHTISEFYCVICGKKGIPIMRRPGHQREPGHLKKLFCLYCGKQTNHAEIRPFGSYNKEDFIEEFELGRFVDGKKIPVSELMPCKHHTDCKYNKDGKCWNANNSYKCSVKLGKNDPTQNLLERGW